jgi:hypothetical protein
MDKRFAPIPFPWIEPRLFRIRRDPPRQQDIDVSWCLDPQDLFHRRLDSLRLMSRHGWSKARRIEEARKTFRRRLLEQFHSLGSNCEFGFVQKRFHADPLDLFRFAGISTSNLADALNEKLEKLAQPDHYKVEFDGSFENCQPQLVSIVDAYGLCIHGGALPARTGFETVKTMQLKRLNLLARKLFEDLSEAQRIFVHKSETATRSDIARLHDAIRRYGPNELLWVTVAEQDKPPGTVERLEPGLIRGYIDRFANLQAAEEVSKAVWLQICGSAFQLCERPFPPLRVT